MLVMPIIMPFINPINICVIGLSKCGILNFMFVKNKIEFVIKIKAIKKIIICELKDFSKKAPG